ncbi:MAG TPA: MiaB/RimO family radical SAM methylthiotransferase [Candidatus Absconditabacterales bacterium]|nr:MiaB/RimO family radical SAM methylthiotransferase [Candidatus Absconditabacterales bacterium]
MIKFNFSFINLGCNKNLVDTQFLLGNIFELAENNPNYEVHYSTDPYDQDVKYVFLNTCGFISSAREEMFENMYKLLDQGKEIYLMGCGAYYFKNLDKTQIDKDEMKKWDELMKNDNIHFVSWSDWDKVNINNLINGYDSKKIGQSKIYEGTRAYTNAEYGFEYLKIAEGCNNNCSFCIIPKIRGKQKSLPMENILKEFENMVNAGIEEIILIAQDTNRYGIDLYGKSMLFELLEKIEEIEGDFRYRILYLYPDILTLNQLEKLKNFKKFIPYFDIPLQHISTNVLKNMGRFYDQKNIYKLLNFIDENFDTRFVRTNIIVGFPGETEEEFKELCEFLEKSNFDNIALFEYHDEPLAESSKLLNKIDGDIIHERFLKLKKIVEFKVQSAERRVQSETSSLGTLNTELIGYIMGFKGTEDNPTIIVRPRLHAPEIDSYDKIKLNQIIGAYSESGELDIGVKIEYKK